MRIGIDLDDVVFEFVRELLNIYQRTYNKKVNYDEVSSYNFNELLNISRKEFSDLIMSKFDKRKIENLELCEGVYDSVNRLSKEHEIYFITSRVRKEGTLESLNKYFNHINFELYFSSNPYVGNFGKDKGEICKNMGIDYMIEDSREHAEICSKKGIKTILLDKPWNKKYGEHYNIIKLKNWNEVLDKINGVSYGN